MNFEHGLRRYKGDLLSTGLFPERYGPNLSEVISFSTQHEFLVVRDQVIVRDKRYYVTHCDRQGAEFIVTAERRVPVEPFDIRDHTRKIRRGINVVH